VNVDSEPIADFAAEVIGFDFDAIFRAEHVRISRIIARIVRDPGRAEELAAEVFWKLFRTSKAQGPKASGWLYRTATRIAIDELRRQTRRDRCEWLYSSPARIATPEDLHFRNDERQRLRLILASMKTHRAQLLVLHSEGFTYEEIAATLTLNPASVGTLLSRAEEELRTRYIKRYGAVIR